MASLRTGHQTYVHHLALDPSGSLLASCSSDKTVEVFHRNTAAGSKAVWEPGCTMKDHSGPLLRMAWCQHREYGPLLATSGADLRIYIYHISISSHEGRTSLHAVCWSQVRGYEKDVITDLAFIPPQQYPVLLLSTASLDGGVRLYDVQHSQQLQCLHRVPLEVDAAAEGSGDGVAMRGEGAPGTHANSTDRDVGVCVVNPRVQPPAPPGPMLRCGGVTSIGWFPGASEKTMTLAVGTASGRFLLYRYISASNTFMAIPALCVERGILRCRAPVCNVSWAPPVGRRFQLLAICSRSEVFILRLNCVSPSMDEEHNFELFRVDIGAVSASWSRSSTFLYLATDDRSTQVIVLQMENPVDHQSWKIVSCNAVE